MTHKTQQRWKDVMMWMQEKKTDLEKSFACCLNETQNKNLVLSNELIKVELPP